MLNHFKPRFQEYLGPVRAIREAGVYHYGRQVSSSPAATIVINGREYINFISNNYLGLSVHPRVIAAVRQAALDYGAGMCGSPLACGTTTLHLQLSERTARWFGMEAALIFATGYQALLGAIAALVNPGDTVIVDGLAHRSIIDGAKLSGATIRTFAHNRMDDLAAVLARTSGVKRRLVVADAVYSMEGDLADLPGLHELCEEHEAALLLDEAHSLGVMGQGGHGLMEHFQMPGAADVVAGTFSKFGGAVGGYAAGPADVIDYLKHASSPYIFSSSLPPPTCAGILAAFDVFEQEPEWHARLWDNVHFLLAALKSAGFDTGASRTPVVPIITGDAMLAMRFNHLAFQEGLYASPVMAPLVPPKKSRLRLGVMARHTRPQLEQAVEILARIGKEIGVLH